MPVMMLSQYVVRVTTEAELPPGYQYLEYNKERYGVLPKRGCADCYGRGSITRNGESAKCECLWRRMFNARGSSRPQAVPAFVTNAPGLVDDLRRRRVVLQKQLADVQHGLAGTQSNMAEELAKHDELVATATQAVEQANEAHAQIGATIDHLEKSLEYNKGRADELRAQARELESQSERDRLALGKLRSHELHQAGLERDRARKRVEKLAEDRNKIQHRWHKQLRDPQRDLRKAEERLSKLERQISHLDVADLTDAPLAAAVVPAEPAVIDPFNAAGLAVPASTLITGAPVNRHPETSEVLIDSLAGMPAGEINPPTAPASEPAVTQ